MEKQYTTKLTADQIELLLRALVTLRMRNEDTIKLLTGIDGCSDMVDKAAAEIAVCKEIFALLYLAPAG